MVLIGEMRKAGVSDHACRSPRCLPQSIQA
jgi:hypothetical protein